MRPRRDLLLASFFVSFLVFSHSNGGNREGRFLMVKSMKSKACTPILVVI